MARFRPAYEVLPTALQATPGIRRRGKQRSPTKTPTSIRLDTDVMRAFQAAGKGWQTRINAVLREAIETGQV